MFVPNIQAYKDFPDLLKAQFTWSDTDQVGRQWFSIKSQSKEEHEITIYDFIGIFGVEAEAFIKEIYGLHGKLTVRMNTPGGDVFDGLNIYNALTRHDGMVHVEIDGLAASAGSLIAMAGKTINMNTGAMLMIHDAWGMAVGNAEDMAAMADTLDKISGELAGIYSSRTGNGQRAVRAMMRDETWMTSKEAIEQGFADKPKSDKQPEPAALDSVTDEQSSKPPIINKGKMQRKLELTQRI